MFFPNFYFFNGTAYAGKSTMVRMLAEKHNGIACGENYHNAYLDQLDSAICPSKLPQVPRAHQHPGAL